MKTMPNTTRKSRKPPPVSIEPFKLDIDELIEEFAKNESTTLVDMKKVWISRKFSFIFEARPTTNAAWFMQSLYAHSFGYMVSGSSLSRRLGGLYCLYCLHETQPYKPPFRIYFSLGELRGLKKLVIDSKKENVKVASALVNRMLVGNMFLFGAVDLNESSAKEKLKELKEKENASIRIAQKKLFADSRIEHFIHMDLGMELDVHHLKKMSADYEAAKKLAIKGAGDMVDIRNIEHLTKNERLIGDVVEETAEEWSNTKEMFYQQTEYGKRREHVNADENGENENIDGHSKQRENLRQQQRHKCFEVKEPSSGDQDQGDDGKLEEDGNDDDLALELENALSQDEGDSDYDLAMELEQALSDSEGDDED